MIDAFYDKFKSPEGWIEIIYFDSADVDAIEADKDEKRKKKDLAKDIFTIDLLQRFRRWQQEIIVFENLKF